jgi:hypothetical protein
MNRKVLALVIAVAMAFGAGLYAGDPQATLDDVSLIAWLLQ